MRVRRHFVIKPNGQHSIGDVSKTVWSALISVKTKTEIGFKIFGQTVSKPVTESGAEDSYRLPTVKTDYPAVTHGTLVVSFCRGVRGLGLLLR